MSKTNTFIDVHKAVQDSAYAKTLTQAQWQELVTSPEWFVILGEYPEMAQSFIEANQDSLNVFGYFQQTEEPQEETGLLGVGAKENYSVLGSRIPRIQGIGVVTSIGNYVENMTRPGMLFQKTLRSPHPHANILSIDTSEAEAMPGVVDIIHFFNLSEEENARVSSGPPPRYLFNQEVLQVGAPVAALVAESEHVADEAIRKIKVEYEVLPAVLDMFEGMQASTLKQWDNEYDGTILNIQEASIGDIEAGFAEADAIVEVESSRSTEQHLALEPTSSLVYWENDRLMVYFTTQWAHGTRNTMAQRLGVPQNQIRVIQTGYMGSGYGYRAGADEDEVHAAILSRRTGRPIKRVATRSEDFVTRTHRPQFALKVRAGAKSDGTLTALDFDVTANVGAQRASAAAGAWFNFQTLYNAPNINLKGTDVFTNSYRSGPYRCVSHPAGTLAMETTLDQLANEIGMDPVEFRLKNFNLVGNLFNGQPFSNPGIATTLTGAAEAIGWADKWHAPGTNEVRPGVFHGIGIASHSCSHGGGLGGRGMVVVNPDGSMNVISASNDLGGGQRTEMAMIGAETVGIPFEKVHITPYVDTDNTADTIGTFGSLQTNTGGSGVYEAGMDAKRQILSLAVGIFARDQELEVTPEDLDTGDGFVFVKENPEAQIPIAQVVASGGFGAAVIGRGNHQMVPGFTRIAYATHAAEVEIDTLTGTVKVIDYAAAHDIGKAMNPLGLEQQIQGGVTMALGAALTEEMLIDHATGLPLTDNILEYKALSIKDLPFTTKVVLVEHARAYGVYGAHGIGEPPMSPPGPAISNAIFNAIGVRITDMPYTRDKILAAIKAA